MEKTEKNTKLNENWADLFILANLNNIRFVEETIPPEKIQYDLFI